MTRLQIWKLQDKVNDVNDNVNHTTTMRISGRSMDESAILASLTAAKNDPQCTELDINDVEFDLEEAAALIHVLRSKRIWKVIRMGGCRGQSVSDVVMACMSGIADISLFHWQQTSHLSAATAFAISYGLKYAPALRELSLAIHLTQDHATMLAKALARNVDLETLNMSGSVIDPAAVGSFGFAMRLNRTLKSLILDGCHLEDKHVALIVNALLEHPNLKSLSLQQNSCHDEGMGAIAAMLHHDQLEDLDLSYLIRKKKEVKPPTPPPEPEDDEKEEEKEESEETTGDAADDTKDEAVEDGKDEAKEEATPTTTTTTASTEDQDIEDPDGQRVHNTSLKILQLAGNGLNDNFILSLLGIFGETSALQELNLFGNRITDRGVTMIVAKLSKLKRLKNLWLGHNPFSSFASMELVEAMRTNFALEEVTIRTMDNDAGKEASQETLDYYARLNRGGRKIFSAHEDTVPLALWAWVLERTSRIYWGGSTGNVLLDAQDMAHSADSIFCLLHGPVLFSNPYLPSMANGTTTATTTASVVNGTEYKDIGSNDGGGGGAAAGDEDNADGEGWQTTTGTTKRKGNRNKKKKGKRNFA